MIRQRCHICVNIYWKEEPIYEKVYGYKNMLDYVNWFYYVKNYVIDYVNLHQISSFPSIIAPLPLLFVIGMRDNTGGKSAKHSRNC